MKSDVCFLRSCKIPFLFHKAVFIQPVVYLVGWTVILIVKYQNSHKNWLAVLPQGILRCWYWGRGEGQYPDLYNLKNRAWGRAVNFIPQPPSAMLAPNTVGWLLEVPIYLVWFDHPWPKIYISFLDFNANGYCSQYSAAVTIAVARSGTVYCYHAICVFKLCNV